MLQIIINMEAMRARQASSIASSSPLFFASACTSGRTFHRSRRFTSVSAMFNGTTDNAVATCQDWRFFDSIMKKQNSMQIEDKALENRTTQTKAAGVSRLSIE